MDHRYALDPTRSVASRAVFPRAGSCRIIRLRRFQQSRRGAGLSELPVSASHAILRNGRCHRLNVTSLHSLAHPGRGAVAERSCGRIDLSAHLRGTICPVAKRSARSGLPRWNECHPGGFRFAQQRPYVRHTRVRSKHNCNAIKCHARLCCCHKHLFGSRSAALRSKV